MDYEIDLEESLDEYLVRTGGQTNSYGGIYHNGMPYGIRKRSEIRDIYMSRSLGGMIRPNISEIAAVCGVSRTCVRRIENEVLGGGTISGPPARTGRGGYGAYSMDLADYWLLILLYREEPSRTIGSYVHQLAFLNGTEVSCTTVTRILEKSFPYSAKLRAVNLIPLDKFRYENMIKAGEFVDLISKFPLCKLKCVDEKLLKNAEGIGRRSRRDPITGVVPPVFTQGDFRNTFKMLGICGIDRRVTPVFYKIHKDKNDSEEYNDFILEVRYGVNYILLN